MNTDAGDIRTRRRNSKNSTNRKNTRNRKSPRNQNPQNLRFVTTNNLDEVKLQSPQRIDFKPQYPQIPKDVSNGMQRNSLPNRPLLPDVESCKESNVQSHQFQNKCNRVLLPIPTRAAQDICHATPLLKCPESTLIPGLDRYPPVLSENLITTPVKSQSFVFIPGCHSDGESFLQRAPKKNSFQGHQFRNRAADNFCHGRPLPKYPESTLIPGLDRFPPVLKKASVPNSTSTAAVKQINSTGNMSNEQTRLNGKMYLRNDDDEEDDDDDDDVIYMFTVDATPAGRIVEQIDLSLGDRDSSSSLPTVSFIQVPKRSGITNPEMNVSPGTDTSALKIQSKGTTLKRKSSVMSEEGAVRGAAKRTHQPRCSLCDLHYDALAERNDYMLIADCGHLFCHPCINEVIKKRKCAICLTTVLAVRKLFL